MDYASSFLNQDQMLQMLLRSMGNTQMSGETDPGQISGPPRLSYSNYSFAAPNVSNAYTVGSSGGGNGSSDALANVLASLMGGGQKKQEAPAQAAYIDPRYFANQMGGVQQYGKSGEALYTTTPPPGVTDAYARQFLGQSGVPTIGQNMGFGQRELGNAFSSGAYRGGSQKGSGGNRI